MALSKLTSKTRTSMSIITLLSMFSVLISIATSNDTLYMSKLLEALTPTPHGWSLNTTFCSWSGVRCTDPLHVDVYAIVLPSKSLTGTLPSGLNSLSKLAILDLNYNSLSGPLPSLANLAALETVDFSFNNFSSIPDNCFLGLTSLETLNLAHNLNLRPWAFPSELTHSLLLEKLYFRATNIIGCLPTDIFDSFPYLKYVALSYNKINGSLPISLGRSRVRYFWINNQQNEFGLTGTIEVISSMKYLFSASLQNNRLTGSIPDLSNCTNLFNLQLKHNALTGVVPHSLMSLPHLQEISLDNNLLQGQMPVFWTGVNLTITGNNSFCRDDAGPCAHHVMILLEIAAAFDYPAVLASSWRGNDPCDGWDFIVCELEGEEIVTINLENQNLNGTISPAFSNLTGLGKLILAGNNLMGEIPKSLTTLSQLELLDLSNNNISGQVPEFPYKVKLITTGNFLLGSSQGAGENAAAPFDNAAAPSDYDVTTTRRPSKAINFIWLSGAGAVTFVVVIVLLIICKHKGYFRVVQNKIFKQTGVFLDHNVEDFIKGYNLLVPKRYGYAEVELITNSFQDKLGEGGYGVVYKGSLPDGRHVAVKVIRESKGSGEEFMNEVSSISRTSHVNIVSLLGFCYEMNKKSLIYEFMPNGSLEKFIYTSGFPNSTCNLDWNTLYQIAIGIAQGLDYLHQNCIPRILHLDMKPQNILLDEEFCPKISDFGLAKICQKKESTVSILSPRGTIGYIAPEVSNRAFGRVSHKSDVYSYGMLILETIGARKNHETGSSHTTEMYFPDWIYNDLEQDNNLANCLDISREEDDMVRKITLVSLWCIQMYPSDRPSMKKVIKMLEGSLQSIPYPPKPILHSPERSPLQSSHMSSNNSYKTSSRTTDKDGSP